MAIYKLTYKAYGKSAILVEWPNKIDQKILDNLLHFKNKILKKSIKVIVEVITSYNSLTIIYQDSIENIYSEISALKSIYSGLEQAKKRKINQWKIPVCYDPEFAIDLDECSKLYKLKKQEIISLHTKAVYTIYCIGFLPGFLYLGGLDKQLHFNRKAKPRIEVLKGAVGIGGQQTGIYPQNSPGGWNIIGNSPVTLFDPQLEKPCFAQVGDTIKFYAIDLNEYHEISLQVNNRRYQTEKY